MPRWISRLPTPIAAPAVAGCAPACADGAGDVENSQLPRPAASVSSVIVGSTSVNRVTSKRRDSSGSSAICASTRFAVSICGVFDHGALPNETSGNTIFGSSDTEMSTGPPIASVRPVSVLTRAASGATKRFGSTVATAIATAIRSSATSPPAAPRIRSAVRRIRSF